MRFVKTPKRTTSSVTTRGWSGKNSHHPQYRDVDFVAVDGEGITLPGEHRYVLFGVGDQQIEDPNGLHWTDVFEFLYSQCKPHTAYVGFFLGYDFTQIIKTMPEDRAYMMLTSQGRALRQHKLAGKVPHPVESNGWQYDMLGMKRLRIRPKDCDCPIPTCGCDFRPWQYICDVGPFFQASFLSVIDPSGWAEGTEIVTAEEFELIKQGKDRRDVARLDDDMRSYNLLENDVLVRVMRTLDKGLRAIDIHLPPSKWFGPGQAAQAWLKGEDVPAKEAILKHVPMWFLEAARKSYYGGWFEIFMHGLIPGESHEYDINSAYPAIIADLPCLLHGEYTQGSGLPETKKGDLCIVYARLLSPCMPHNRLKGQPIGAMLHRDTRGQILRPMATEGWFYWDELQAAQRAKTIKRLDNRGLQQVIEWVNYHPCDCPPPMRGIRDLYLKRLEVGKKTPLGKGAKLVYNSAYGKFAQSVGDPIFANPVYASRITSGCRTTILDAIATHPKGQSHVAMVATDAVYFLSPHPGLRISTALGEWDYTSRTNLTLFKPGVYWDDETRRKILQGRDPTFKARGFKASDFAASIARVDSEYRSWTKSRSSSIVQCSDWKWPSVRFATAFTMTTALQALRRHKWHLAGDVQSGAEFSQNADPSDKRCSIYWDSDQEVFRSTPYAGIELDPATGNFEWIPSTPYSKRFGMEDPFSDESRDSMGITDDGSTSATFAWALR